MIRHTILMVLASTCAAVTAITAAVAPAFAAPQSKEPAAQAGTYVVTSRQVPGRYSWPVRHVRIGDLDLTEVKQQAVLSGRIKKAVTSICGVDGPDDPLLRGDEDACRSIAEASARPQMAAAIDSAFARKGLVRTRGYSTGAGGR